MLTQAHTHAHIFHHNILNFIEIRLDFVIAEYQLCVQIEKYQREQQHQLVPRKVSYAKFYSTIKTATLLKCKSAFSPNWQTTKCLDEREKTKLVISFESSCFEQQLLLTWFVRVYHTYLFESKCVWYVFHLNSNQSSLYSACFMYMLKNELASRE